ncbi:MAG: PilZ domain-containing protein [Gammaproteobacteria bacterium]|nr:PilZ domain-containing protein [Gammaproteobacteria bacterium]MDH3465020.1 PilZ domain-containing protein [Gammaproteobacteria bacterium]
MDTEHTEQAERREFGRVRFGLNGAFRNRRMFTLVESECRVVDLSFGGAKVAIPTINDTGGDTVEISIPLENESSMSLPGEVVRSQTSIEDQVVGVRFKGISVAEQVELHRVLRRLAMHDIEFDYSTPLTPFKKRNR